MKVVLVVLAVVLGCQAVSVDEVLKQWRTYQVKFEKTYKSPVDNLRRLSIFKDNLQKIEAHNVLYAEGKETFLMGLTPFTDWTSEEFMQFVNKYKMPMNKSGNIYKFEESLAVPDSFDWRPYGAVREVKNQGIYENCWSFSTTGALEGAAKLTKNLSVSLSEQNLLDCAFADDPVTGFLYVQRHGITTEAEYPYTGLDKQNCTQKDYVLKATGYVNVPSDETILKQVVATVGPVSTGLCCTDNLHNYVSGVLYDRTCTSEINHAVLIVGYGTENGLDYWLIKNSWGPSWGEDGYFKLARNHDNNCEIATIPSYPTV